MTEKSLKNNELMNNITRIREVVARAAEVSGRQPDDVSIMAVTKTVPAEIVNAAIDQGIRLLGENRAQELCEKYDCYQKDGVDIHFIGHLQTNKVKQIVDKVSMIQSVGTIKLAEEINRQCSRLDKKMNVLIEVNIGREEHKDGVYPDRAEDMIRQIAEKMPMLSVRGLMAIPPLGPGGGSDEKYFYQMRQLFIDIMSKNIDNSIMDTLSMGMSGDYDKAVAHGSTMVRLGTALFGARAGYPPKTNR